MATRRLVAAVPAYEADLSYARAKNPLLIPWAGDHNVLIDRFDALHLVYDLPGYKKEERLSSDVEDDDGFDLSGDELHSFVQARRREQLASLRSERMATKAALERDGRPHQTRPATQAATATIQQPLQEENPSAAIEQLMQHTAKALLASPDPAVLEMRIMTNHAQDERFAFLRGKWSTAWKRIYTRRADSPVQKAAVLDLGLGYESSDEEREETPPPPLSPRKSSTPPPDPDEVQRMRRERAKVWAQNRKRRADDVEDDDDE